MSLTQVIISLLKKTLGTKVVEFSSSTEDEQEIGPWPLLHVSVESVKREREGEGEGEGEGAVR